MVAPEVLEPRRGQLRISNRVLNVAVAEIGLQRARIVPLVGQGITAGVPEHVWVRLEGQLGLPARPLDHAGEASRAERCPAFRGKHVGRSAATNKKVLLFVSDFYSTFSG